MGDSGQQVGPGLYVKLGLDTSGMLGGVGGVAIVLNQTLSLFSKFESVAQGFLDLATNAGRFGKELKDNARDLGLSTKEFQQWTHTAIAAGSSAEEITGSIRQMSVRMKEATDPSSEMGKTLAALGVNALDASGNMRSMNDVLLDVFPALNALPEGFNRNQAAMVLFGRGFSNITDLTSLSRGELQQLIDQAPVFSDEKIDKLDDFNKKMNLLNERVGILYVNIGTKLVPVLENSLIPAFESAEPFITDMITLMDDLGEAVDRAGTGYAILKDPSNWVKISESFNARQAAREWSREWGDELGKAIPNLKMGWDPDKLFDTKKTTPYLDEIGKTAAKSAKEVQDLQRSLEDLNQSITDTQLSEIGTTTDLEDLWKEYNKNRDERKLADLQADPDTSGGQVFAARVKVLDDEQVKIVQKINLANQDLAKDKTKILRANQDLVTGMVEGDTKIVDSLVARVAVTETQYDALTQLSTEHWTTESGLAQTAYQSILDYAAETVNFAGSHPIIQKVVMLSKSGYDINPSALPSITAPLLKSADFSNNLNKTPTTTSTENKSGETAGTGGGNSTSIVVNQTNYGVASDADALNKSIGKIAALGGALP